MRELPGPLSESGKLLACLSLVCEPEVICGRRRKLVRVISELRKVTPNHDYPVRIFERQGPQESRIDDTEDRGVGADAEGQGSNYDQRQTRTISEGTQSMPDVLPNGSHSTLLSTR